MKADTILLYMSRACILITAFFMLAYLTGGKYGTALAYLNALLGWTSASFAYTRLRRE